MHLDNIAEGAPLNVRVGATVDNERKCRFDPLCIDALAQLLEQRTCQLRGALGASGAIDRAKRLLKVGCFIMDRNHVV